MPSSLLSSWQKRIILSVKLWEFIPELPLSPNWWAYLTVCELILEVLPYGQLPLLQHW
jgi:hypothetical protein